MPLAALLDRLGFFAAAAARTSRSSASLLGLWVLAAVVTAVLNLDTTVVLLTPLYLRIADRRGDDAVVVAAMPLLLAGLASSALPVSNLTTLLVAERIDIGPAEVVAHLGLPTLAACTVGWFAFRRRHPWVATGSPTDGPGAAADAADETDHETDHETEPVDARRALRIGGAVVGALLLGFTVGGALGIPAWTVALAADVVLVALLRWVPWRNVPLATAAAVAAVGLAVTALVPADAVASILRSDAVGMGAGAAGAATVLGNGINNLPATLIGIAATTTPTWGLWGWLLGVNAGATLLPIGALANILWLRIVRGQGHRVSVRRYVGLTAPVVLPALVAAVAVLSIEQLLWGA